MRAYTIRMIDPKTGCQRGVVTVAQADGAILGRIVAELMRDYRGCLARVEYALK
jgi:hypothetical protein